MPALIDTARVGVTRLVVVGLLHGAVMVVPTTPALAGEPPAPPVPYRVTAGVTFEPAAPVWMLPLADYRLTGRFGARSHLWADGHTGLDFAAPSGTPIRAVADGTVTEEGYDGPYGYKVVVRLEDGREIWYAHQRSNTVAVGQRVAAGDLIGYVGNTGNSTGDHLHLEVRTPQGVPIDPYLALRAEGLRP